MSHFSGLVISNDVDELLAPYNEQDEYFFTEHKLDNVEAMFLQYKDDKEFIEFCSTDKCRNMFNFCEWYFGKKPITIWTERVKAQRRKQNHCYFTKGADNSLVFEGRYEYYNDLAKYDYYSVDGGRFADSRIIYKDGNKDNNILSNLDLDAMLMQAKEDMEADYLEIRDLFLKGTTNGSVNKNASFLPKFIHWEDYAKKVEDGVLTIDEARNQYHEQETIKVWDKMIKASHFFLNAENYDCSLEEYSNNATLPFYVIVDNDGWHERGEIGWFGMASNEKDGKEWSKEQIAILRKNIEENPDTEFTLCDFHI